MQEGGNAHGPIVPVAPIYTSHEIIYMIEDAEVQTVICTDTNFCYVKEAFADTHLKQVVVTNLIGTRTIQSKLRKDLQGLEYKFNKKGLVAHSNFMKWMGETIREQLRGLGLEPALRSLGQPFPADAEPGSCMVTGKPSEQRVIFARAY